MTNGRLYLEILWHRLIRVPSQGFLEYNTNIPCSQVGHSNYGLLTHHWPTCTQFFAGLLMCCLVISTSPWNSSNMTTSNPTNTIPLQGIVYTIRRNRWLISLPLWLLIHPQFQSSSTISPVSVMLCFPRLVKSFMCMSTLCSFRDSQSHNFQSEAVPILQVNNHNWTCIGS